MSRFLSRPLLFSLLVLLLFLCVLRISASSNGKKKGPKSNMRTLTAKQLQDLEEEWEDDEDEPKGGIPKSQRGPPMAGPKAEMAFVSLREQFKKPEAEKLAGQWSDLLNSGGVKVRSYVVEENKILVVADENGFHDMMKAKKFLLNQDEVIEFEWNQIKEKPKKKIKKDIVEEEENEPEHPFAKFGINV